MTFARRSGPKGPDSHLHVCVLMGEEPFDLKSVAKRDVHDGTDGGRAVGINWPPRDQLEEVAAEAIPTKWRDLDALSLKRRGGAESARDR